MGLSKAEKLQYCRDCSENFYNGSNPYGIKECWHLSKAKIVTRYRIGWHTPMDKKERFTEVKTLDCCRDNGRFAYLENLPEHLRGVPIK